MLRFKNKYIIPIILATTSFFIYIFTAAPFMLFEDAPRYLAAIITLGVAEPAAPLYVFLAHFFIYLPIGSIVFRVQLFSSLMAGSSLVLLYRLVIRILEIPISIPIPQQLSKKELKKLRKLGHQQPELSNQLIAVSNERTIVLAGIFSMLTLGFSYEFWSQAQNIETFALCSFISLIVLNLILSKVSYKNIFIISAIIVFVCGISTATDPPVMASIFPTTILFIWFWKKTLCIKYVLLLAIVGFAGAFLGWSYLLFRADNQLILNRENFSTIQGIWDVATGRGLNVYSPTTGLVNGFTFMPDLMLDRAWHYVTQMLFDFTPILIPFIIFGAIFMWRHQRHVFLLLALVPLTNLGLSILYASGNKEGWYVQSDIIFALFAGVGYLYIANFLTSRVEIIPSRVLLTGLFIFSLIPVIYWWNTLNRHRWNLTQDYIENMYAPLKGPGILLGQGDLWAATADYVYNATRYKHDIIPISGNGLFTSEWQQKQLAASNHITIPDTSYLGYGGPLAYSKFMNNFLAANVGKFHIYITGSASKEITGLKGPDTQSLTIDLDRFVLIPVGNVQEVIFKKAKHASNNSNMNDYMYRFHNSFPLSQPYFLEDSYNVELQQVINEIALSYDNEGTYLQVLGQNAKAEIYYRKAYSLIATGPLQGAPSPGVASYKAQIIADLGLFYERENNPKVAIIYFGQAHAGEPDNPTWIYDMAQAESQLGHDDMKNKYLAELKNLSAQLPNSNVKPKLTQSSVAGWKQFTNSDMNLSFTYPEQLQLNQLSPQLVALVEDSNHSDPQHVILLYVANVSADTNNFDIDLPFDIPSQLIQSKSGQLNGFNTMLNIYSDGNNQVQLFMMKHGQQLIAIRLPEHNLLKPAVIDKIFASIKTPL